MDGKVWYWGRALDETGYSLAGTRLENPCYPRYVPTVWPAAAPPPPSSQAWGGGACGYASVVDIPTGAEKNNDGSKS